MTICAAVVGAGRMGSVVAERLPKSTKKIIIDIDLEKARRLAGKVDGSPRTAWKVPEKLTWLLWCCRRPY